MQSSGSKRSTRFQSVYTTGAMAIGVPGCPELACCTASMLSVRMVFTQSWSSCLVSTKFPEASLFELVNYEPDNDKSFVNAGLDHDSLESLLSSLPLDEICEFRANFDDFLTKSKVALYCPLFRTQQLRTR